MTKHAILLSKRPSSGWEWLHSTEHQLPYKLHTKMQGWLVYLLTYCRSTCTIMQPEYCDLCVYWAVTGDFHPSILCLLNAKRLGFGLVFCVFWFAVLAFMHMAAKCGSVLCEALFLINCIFEGNVKTSPCTSVSLSNVVQRKVQLHQILCNNVCELQLLELLENIKAQGKALHFSRQKLEHSSLTTNLHINVRI